MHSFTSLVSYHLAPAGMVKTMVQRFEELAHDAPLDCSRHCSLDADMAEHTIDDSSMALEESRAIFGAVQARQGHPRGHRHPGPGPGPGGGVPETHFWYARSSRGNGLQELRQTPRMRRSRLRVHGIPFNRIRPIFRRCRPAGRARPVAHRNQRGSSQQQAPRMLQKCMASVCAGCVSIRWARLRSGALGGHPGSLRALRRLPPPPSKCAGDLPPPFTCVMSAII